MNSEPYIFGQKRKLEHSSLAHGIANSRQRNEVAQRNCFTFHKMELLRNQKTLAKQNSSSCPNQQRTPTTATTTSRTLSSSASQRIAVVQHEWRCCCLALIMLALLFVANISSTSAQIDWDDDDDPGTFLHSFFCCSYLFSVLT